MKKLHFLERDYKCPSSDESIDHGKRNLRYYSKLEKSLIDEMEIHYQYHITETKAEKDELIKLLFNSENVIVSYSMYISGSDYDFLYFIQMAGRNNVTGVTYIDTSGNIVEFLNKNIRDEKNALDVVFGINGNNIITLNYDKGELEDGFFRVLFAPTSKNAKDGYFKLEKVNLSEFIQ